MTKKGPTLIDVLQPRHFETNPARAKVTRTIRQPETDELERLDALLGGSERITEKRVRAAVGGRSR